MGKQWVVKGAQFGQAYWGPARFTHWQYMGCVRKPMWVIKGANLGCKRGMCEQSSTGPTWDPYCVPLYLSFSFIDVAVVWFSPLGKNHPFEYIGYSFLNWAIKPEFATDEYKFVRSKDILIQFCSVALALDFRLFTCVIALVLKFASTLISHWAVISASGVKYNVVLPVA